MKKLTLKKSSNKIVKMIKMVDNLVLQGQFQMQMIVLRAAAETSGCLIKQILLRMKLPLKTSPVLSLQVFVAYLTVANLNSNNLSSNNQRQVLHKIQALTQLSHHNSKMVLAFT